MCTSFRACSYRHPCGSCVRKWNLGCVYKMLKGNLTEIYGCIEVYLLGKLVAIQLQIHSRAIYLLKPTLGPSRKFKHLTRAEEVVITRLRIGHTKATKWHILSRGPPTACQHCARLWPLNTCSWSVLCYSKLAMNTTHLNRWRPSLRRFPRFA